VLTNVID
jgi:U3 small nucleolar RNA-associated protein 4